MKRNLLLRAALMGALLGAGCATGGNPSPAGSAGTVDETTYVIGVPDLLRIVVWQHPDLSTEVPVRRDGKISVPLLDDIQAAGLTPEELKAVITERLSGSIRSPNVTVIVASPESQSVTVLGGVAQSGTVPLRGQMGAVEAIAAAGGFSAWANQDDIRVIRVVDGQRVSYRVDYRDYLNAKPGADVVLQPGDVVIVPE
jgi:polysaccharide export outer membrane protein